MSNEKVSNMNVTLRMLLENPELLEAPNTDEFSSKIKDASSDSAVYDIQSAFLGPTIWQNTIPSEYFDLPSDMFDSKEASAWQNEQMKQKGDIASMIATNQSPIDFDICLTHMEEHSPASYQQHPQFETAEPILITPGPKFRSANATSDKTSVKSEKNDRGVIVLPKENRPDFNVSLKSIVGDEMFDPSKRSFTTDELRVIPILPKSQKNFVPSEKKDDHYWTRRLKNNSAAKRSREAKRMKENQITLRTAFLEQENSRLRNELDQAVDEKNKLKERLRKYEYVCD